MVSVTAHFREPLSCKRSESSATLTCKCAAVAGFIHFHSQKPRHTQRGLPWSVYSERDWAGPNGNPVTRKPEQGKPVAKSSWSLPLARSLLSCSLTRWRASPPWPCLILTTSQWSRFEDSFKRGENWSSELLLGYLFPAKWPIRSIIKTLWPPGTKIRFQCFAK
jgi:hypothetical protein